MIVRRLVSVASVVILAVITGLFLSNDGKAAADTVATMYPLQSP